MMRADCLMSLSQQQWPPVTRTEHIEKSINDSGISPGRTSSEANSSSPQSPDRSDHPRFYPKRLEIDIPAADSQQEDSLERLKLALERSTALSGIFKTENSLDSPTNNNNDGESSQDGANEKKEFRCPLCAYSTPYRHRYQEHLATHYSDKCTICDFTAQNISDLRSHLIEVHKTPDLLDLSDPNDNNSDCQDEEDNCKRGKNKSFKCKQCSYVTNTKLDFWEHSKGHIKAEKLLTCTQCPFVTEYKHHLEYHLRNHYGSKPFKCTKCSYSCVNKSMLNSHLKSHSNIYQYRCADCAYATKYCHSLKLHLRKYQHNPAMVLNADGSPNPLPIIDVYGTRRGPKAKPKLHEESDTQEERQNLPGGIVVPTAPQSSPMIYDQAKLVYCNLCEFYTTSFEVLNQHMFIHASDNINHLFKTNNNDVKEFVQTVMEPSSSPVSFDRESSPKLVSPLDLSKPDSPKEKKNRRKGKAYKLERPVAQEEEKESKVEVEVKEEPLASAPPTYSYNCQYCDITFKDVVLYTMHMGYHGFQDPYTCNMCGEVTKDKVSFFLHIARSSHS